MNGSSTSLSGHAYGSDYSWQLKTMRNALTLLGRNEAEMLLTEYSPYVAADYQKDGPVERAVAAMTFFKAAGLALVGVEVEACHPVGRHG